MATYGEFKNQLLRFLNDPSQSIYSDELLYDSFVSAQHAIMPWMGKMSLTTLSSGSGGKLFKLPDDLYEVVSVIEIDSYTIMEMIVLAENSSFGSSDTSNGWLIAPDGYLSLSYETDSDLSLYYIAYWNEPSSGSDTSFEIEVPKIAHRSLLYYAAFRAIAPQSMDVSSLNPYKTRIDSGTPMHNPITQQCDWYRSLFYDEVRHLPKGNRINI